MVVELKETENEQYNTGYKAGLMQITNLPVEKTIDFIRGFNDAMLDLCDFERENCC